MRRIYNILKFLLRLGFLIYGSLLFPKFKHRAQLIEIVVKVFFLLQIEPLSAEILVYVKYHLLKPLILNLVF